MALLKDSLSRIKPSATMAVTDKAAGKDNVVLGEWVTGAEDFSEFATKAPAFYFTVGGMPANKTPETAAPQGWQKKMGGPPAHSVKDDLSLPLLRRVIHDDVGECLHPDVESAVVDEEIGRVVRGGRFRGLVRGHPADGEIEGGCLRRELGKVLRPGHPFAEHDVVFSGGLVQ